jgi:hypothetical protein
MAIARRRPQAPQLDFFDEVRLQRLRLQRLRLHFSERVV